MSAETLQEHKHLEEWKFEYSINEKWKYSIMKKIQASYAEF